MNKSAKNVMLAGLSLGCLSVCAQISFPYTVPANPTAELDVNTSIREPIEPMNLSLNYGPRSYFGFNDANDKQDVRRFAPPSTRWPIGVWANWYNWETDGWETDDSYDGEFDHIITGNPNKRYGFPGLHQLHDEMNFDILWSFNVNYDSPAKAVNRLNDRFEKGFDFEWLELGNEIFWKGQRSWATETAAKYVGVAQAQSAALKAEDSFIQLAVPVTWRETTTTSGWNGVLDNDQSYYDAITVHKYIRHTDASETAANVKEILKAGVVLRATADDMAALFPGKPQWYTEWGVTCGENAISVLGMNDMFLTFFRDQDVFAMNQYHQVNGMDEFLTDTDKKTAYGAAYDVLRAVFEDSELYEGTESATLLDPDTPVVQSAAVNKAGNVVVYAHNKTPNPVPFTLKFDGTTYTGKADHRAFVFSSLNAFPLFEIEEDPLTVVALQTSRIMLPPYSISVISGLSVGGEVSSDMLIEAERAEGQAAFSPFEPRLELGAHTYITMTNGAPTVNYNTVNEELKGWASYDFDLLEAGDVSIELLGKFKDSGSDSFWFRIDGGAWIKFDGLAGGSWKWVELMNGQSLTAGAHSFEIARREGPIKLDRFRLTTANGTFASPRVTEVPLSGVVRIEAEDYDDGGEGFGYHDRTPGNSGVPYRTDDVDIEVCGDVEGGYHVGAVQSGEWLRFPIHVQRAGTHLMRLRGSRAAAGDSSFRVLFNDEQATGNLQFPCTGSPDAWITVESAVELEAGKQIMEVKLTGGDVDLNWIELQSVGVPAPWKTMDIGAVAAKGNTAYENGSFTLNASGADIWNTADEFHFVYRPMSGDGELIARVVSVENTDPWAKAGVMIRETLNAGSAYAATLVSAGNGIQSQYRAVSDEVTTSQTTAGLAAPYWVRMNRAGNTFTAYRSVNGTDWTMQGTPLVIAMNSTVYIGLAASSHADGILGASVFDQVTTTIALTANAGVDQMVIDEDLDGFATVTLDGVASIAGDNEIISYAWTEGVIEMASGATANCTLEFGVHVLTLTVSDGVTTASDEVVVYVEPAAPGLGPVVMIAGWDAWTTADAPTTFENGAQGMAVKTGWNMEYRAGSSDGTFGTFAGADPTVGTTAAYHYTGTRYASMTSASIDFTITDLSGADTTLSGFHFDSIRRGATASWTLEVLSGAISTGLVASGTVDSSYDVNVLSDYDVDLSGLADNTLDADGSVTFRLSFASATAKNLELDNVGLSGARMQVGGGGYPDSNTNSIPDYWEIHYLGGLGFDSKGDADHDGLSNYDEFVAGTHPTNALSNFVIKRTMMEPDGFSFTWDSVNSRTYTVLQTANLISNGSTGSLQVEWAPVSGDLSGTGGELFVTDLTPSSTNRFYKIEVTRP